MSVAPARTEPRPPEWVDGRAARVAVTSAPPRPARPIRVPRSRSRGRTAFLLFSAAVIGLLLTGLVSARALLAQSAFRERDLEARVAGLEARRDRLQVEVARLLAPGRLAREADSQGLRLPEEVHVLRIPREEVGRGRAGVATPAGAAVALQGLLGAGP